MTKRKRKNLSDADILRVLEDASQKYEKYLQLTSITKFPLPDEEISIPERTINHPLNLVIKTED